MAAFLSPVNAIVAEVEGAGLFILVVRVGEEEEEEEECDGCCCCCCCCCRGSWRRVNGEMRLGIVVRSVVICFVQSSLWLACCREREEERSSEFSIPCWLEFLVVRARLRIVLRSMCRRSCWCPFCRRREGALGILYEQGEESKDRKRERKKESRDDGVKTKEYMILYIILYTGLYIIHVLYTYAHVD
jgi:hypothetical protein